MSIGKKLLIFVIAVAAAITLFCTLLFWGSSYSAGKVEISSELIDKIQVAEFESGTLELNSDEFNQIINMYFKAGKYSNVTVKGVKAGVDGSDVYFNIPVTYRGFNLLVRADGNLAYTDDGIHYDVARVSAGKLPVPKKLFLDKVRNKVGNNAVVNANGLYIDKNAIPVIIKSVVVQNSKITVNVEKLTDQFRNQLKSMIEKMYGTGTSASSDKSAGQASKSLDGVSSKLQVIKNSAKTDAQKNVVSDMISAVDKMKSNSGANPYDYAGRLRNSYQKLSDSEKAQLKSLIFSNINGSDVNIINSLLK